MKYKGISYLGDPMNSMKPWKTKIERDIIMSEDLKESGLQGGKVLGNHLALFSFIVGIPLLILGLCCIVNMLLGLGFPTNNAIIILVLVVTSIGTLMTIGGYLIMKG